MAETLFFIIDGFGGEHGPFTIEQIQQMVISRKLKKHQLVRKVGRPKGFEEKASVFFSDLFPEVEQQEKKLEESARQKRKMARKEERRIAEEERIREANRAEAKQYRLSDFIQSLEITEEERTRETNRAEEERTREANRAEEERIQEANRVLENTRQEIEDGTRAVRELIAVKGLLASIDWKLGCLLWWLILPPILAGVIYVVVIIGIEGMTR